MVYWGIHVLWIVYWGLLSGAEPYPDEGRGFGQGVLDVSAAIGTGLGNAVSTVAGAALTAVGTAVGQVALRTGTCVKEAAVEATHAVIDTVATSAREGTVALGQRVENGFIFARDTMRNKLGEVGYVVALVATCAGVVAIIWNAVTNALTVREQRRHVREFDEGEE